MSVDHSCKERRPWHRHLVSMPAGRHCGGTMESLAIANLDNPTELAVTGVSSGKALNIDTSTIQQHVNSKAAKILRATSSTLGSLALKVVFAPDVREPHSLRREAKLLSELNHENVAKLYNAYVIRSHYVLAMPFFPFTLRNLLDSPAFTSDTSGFLTVANHLIQQMCAAVAYIHSKQIAHRDIAPGNWLIDERCHIYLTDFDVAWSESAPETESSGSLHFELGTGPYRAPELLFGARDYDPFAVDSWALGCNIAEFFTALEPEAEDHEGASPPAQTTMLAWMKSKSKPALKRRSLLEGGSSDFTLIGSMFKLLGTPTLETWPEASDLPDFGKFLYKYFPFSDLRKALVNAPPCDGDADPVKLVQTFLKYPRRQRRTAQAAVNLLSASGAAQTNSADFVSALQRLLLPLRCSADDTSSRPC